VFPERADAANCVDVDPSQYVNAVVVAIGAAGDVTTVNKIAVLAELAHVVVEFLENA
jgi:hypothetical protein